MSKLNKNSRAGKLGTVIGCPICEAENTVYHMAWSAITCQTCSQMVNKTIWNKIRHVKPPEFQTSLNQEIASRLPQSQSLH